MCVKKGDIYYADLSPTKGSEQGGVRPVIVVQNDVGNEHSPTTIIVPLTSKTDKPSLPTHIKIYNNNWGLSRNSTVLAEQVRVVDKTRLLSKIGRIDACMTQRIDEVLKVNFD
ncbi:MAG: type II toxin-antitoxin system PemK/MazF family toxin [Clostridiales bacterium]|jgi:mRNA interferase MazF|nr:type II toxin-antitoxin system PemK/MazF family toxin [Clostridiales bacterium]